MHGYDDLAAQFPDVVLSDRYRIHETRPLMPDYLPDDPDAEDTFTLMAEHMLPYVERLITEAGGSVDGSIWTFPPTPSADPLSLNPLEQLYRRSANNMVLLAGGTVEAWDGETANSRTRVFADGAEHDFSGGEQRRPPRSYQARPDNGLVRLSVTYDRSVEVETIRFIEGDAGGFSDMTAEVLVDGIWLPIPEASVISQPPDPHQPYQMIDFVLPEAIMAQGIRVSGNVGGAFGDVVVVELDALSS
jgi:hypothetical protein